MLIAQLYFYWIVDFVDYCNKAQSIHVVGKIMSSTLHRQLNFWKINSYLVKKYL